MTEHMLNIAVVAAAAIVLTACSSGSKGQFMKNCETSLASQTRDADGAEVVCKCTYERLNDELSSKQMAMAADMMGLENNRAISEYAEKNKGATMVSERMQGAAKSCMSSNL